MCLSFLGYAQGENNNWYFGQYSGVNFSEIFPQPLTVSQMNAKKSCGTVSDKYGNLLFYNNGINIWNRQHQIMDNGSGFLHY